MTAPATQQCPLPRHRLTSLTSCSPLALLGSGRWDHASGDKANVTVRSPQRARRAAGDSMRRAANHGSPPALHASAHHGAPCGGLPSTARPARPPEEVMTWRTLRPKSFCRVRASNSLPDHGSQGAPWWALACPPERRPSTLLEHALARTCNLSAATERMCLDAARASARRPHAPSPSPSCQRPRPQASTRICDVAPHEKSRLQHSGFT